MCFIRIRFFSFEFWIIGNGQDTFSPPKSEWAGLDWAFSWGPYLVCFQTLFLAWHGDLMWIIKNNSQHLFTLPSVPPFGSSVCCLCFTWMNISHTGNKFGDFWFYLRDDTFGKRARWMTRCAVLNSPSMPTCLFPHKEQVQLIRLVEKMSYLFSSFLCNNYTPGCTGHCCPRHSIPVVKWTWGKCAVVWDSIALKCSTYDANLSAPD